MSGPAWIGLSQFSLPLITGNGDATGTLKASPASQTHPPYLPVGSSLMSQWWSEPVDLDAQETQSGWAAVFTSGPTESLLSPVGSIRPCGTKVSIPVKHNVAGTGRKHFASRALTVLQLPFPAPDFWAPDFSSGGQGELYWTMIQSPHSLLEIPAQPTMYGHQAGIFRTTCESDWRLPFNSPPVVSGRR